jgi:hypothetical protein
VVIPQQSGAIEAGELPQSACSPTPEPGPLLPHSDDDKTPEDPTALAFGCVDWFMYEADPEPNGSQITEPRSEADKLFCYG